MIYYQDRVVRFGGPISLSDGPHRYVWPAEWCRRLLGGIERPVLGFRAGMARENVKTAVEATYLGNDSYKPSATVSETFEVLP